MPDIEWENDHYVFDPSPAIIPPKTVRCGEKVKQAARVYADIDALLTYDTITEAMELSKSRR